MGGAFLVLAGFAGCGDLRVGAGQRRPLVVDAAEQDDGELGAYVYADRCRGRAVGLPCQGGGAAPAAAGRRCAGWSAWRGLSCRGGTRRRRESGGPVVAATGEAEQYSDQGDRYGRHGGARFAHGRLPDVLVGAACRWWARRVLPSVVYHQAVTRVNVARRSRSERLAGRRHGRGRVESAEGRQIDAANSPAA